MLHAIHSPRQMPKGPAPSLSTLPGQPHATNLDSLLDGSIHVNPSRSWFPLSPFNSGRAQTVQDVSLDIEAV